MVLAGHILGDVPPPRGVSGGQGGEGAAGRHLGMCRALHQRSRQREGWLEVEGAGVGKVEG